MSTYQESIISTFCIESARTEKPPRVPQSKEINWKLVGNV